MPVPTLLLWPQGTPGWVGFSAPLLLGRWVMLFSSLGTRLLVLLPQQNQSCQPCARPRSPFPAPVTHSSSCLPAACQLRMAPAVTPGTACTARTRGSPTRTAAGS